ncbi:TPA: excinuclease ABC subunit C [Candidatus Marinimicrobia bacterium]|nr:excinuclease ABC subunit C [Candidatus Neomarinimicrobiota bacterium]HBY18513.1 excinuclease ABC subunit C [Candidatus Neomarinimicrobiota bacterium]
MTVDCFSKSRQSHKSKIYLLFSNKSARVHPCQCLNVKALSIYIPLCYLKRMDTLEKKLEQVPRKPGVYLFRDEKNEIIYVGKARLLKNRVLSYFRGEPSDPKTSVMISHIRDVEWIITDSETEALLMENNLIKEYTPRYNVRLKDDKSFPFIRITSEPFPRIFITRTVEKDGSRYYGPYTDVHHVRKLLRILHRTFPLRTCRYKLDEATIKAKKIPLCLEYHLHNCEGPCQGLISENDYNTMVEQVIRFIEGHTEETLNVLAERMQEAAKRQAFERAARYRDQIRVIRKSLPRQNVVHTDFEDRDVIGMAVSEETAMVVLFRVREGRIIARETFTLQQTGNRTRNELLKEFLRSYYSETPFIPREVFCELEDEKELFEDFLTAQAGKRIYVITPERGEKARLLTLARKNADMMLKDLMLHRIKRDLQPGKMVQALQEALNLVAPPMLIEGFDISNIQGTHIVASCVVFENGRPRKSDYRKFIIRDLDHPDDFAAMSQVIRRHYSRKLEEKGKLPDLVLIDGGKGQLNVAKQVLDELGLHHLPVIGLAKRLEDVFIPGYANPQNIPKTSPALYLLRRIRDEAHRFAITFHRKRRDDAMVKSILEDIPGIGPKRKAKIFSVYPSVYEMMKDNEKEIAKKTGLSVTLVSEMIAYIRRYSPMDAEKRGKV